MSATLSTLLSRRHELRYKVADSMEMRGEVERVPDLTPACREKVEQLSPELKAFPWVLVLTGMRMKEYLLASEATLYPTSSRSA